MEHPELTTVFGRERIDDRQIAEVIGIAHGIIADGQVTQAEVEYLQKYLDGRLHITQNPVVRVLKQRVDLILADGMVDQDEAADLMETLKSLIGGDFEHGEITKASSLPLCAPAPAPMQFYGAQMCFTGTFSFGPRKDCEAAVRALGADPGSLTSSTRYLVIGAYATESWAQSSFGRKIEKAVDLRAKGKPINIVAEAHWVQQMGSR